jgi:hypothetical protein
LILSKILPPFPAQQGDSFPQRTQEVEFLPRQKEINLQSLPLLFLLQFNEFQDKKEVLQKFYQL